MNSNTGYPNSISHSLSLQCSDLLRVRRLSTCVCWPQPAQCALCYYKLYAHTIKGWLLLLLLHESQSMVLTKTTTHLACTSPCQPVSSDSERSERAQLDLLAESNCAASFAIQSSSSSRSDRVTKRAVPSQTHTLLATR